MLYGILKDDAINTGQDSELLCLFAVPLSVKSNQPAYVQDAMNLKRKAGFQGVQRWEVSTAIASSYGNSGFLVHGIEKGVVIPFKIRIPQMVGLNIGPNTTASVATQGSNSLTTAAPLIPGEFIRIGTDNKVYLVLRSEGNVAVLRPSLNRGVADGSTVYRGGNVSLSVRYDMDTVIGMTFEDGILSNPGVIKFIEAIE